MDSLMSQIQMLKNRSTPTIQPITILPKPLKHMVNKEVTNATFLDLL
jgi:hypothetical protein